MLDVFLNKFNILIGALLLNKQQVFNKQVNNKLVNKEKVSNKKDNYQATASNSYNNNNHYSDLE